MTLLDRWQSLSAQDDVLWEKNSDLANEWSLILYSRCCICGVIQSIENFTSFCGRMRVRHWCGNNLTEMETHSLSGWGMHEQYNKASDSFFIDYNHSWSLNFSLKMSYLLCHVTCGMINVLRLIPIFHRFNQNVLATCQSVPTLSKLHVIIGIC